MPVINGQAVSAEITNPAFLDAQVDDIALGKIGFHNTDPQSGGNIDNIQRCVNRLFTASGVDENMSNGTTYNATSGTIVNGDPYQLALKVLANKFDSITGHTHNTSVAGDGGPITVTAAAATTGSLGTVYLSHTTPIDVTGLDFIGTYNGQVALADHAHKGVRSVAPSGYSQLFDDIVFTPSGSIDISTSGQQIIFHSSGAGSGVSSIAVSGSPQITGNVTLSASGSIVLAESGQNITIFSPTSSSLARSEVALSGANGFGSTNTEIRRFSTVRINTGSDISYSDSATLGASFTINTSGIYSITYSEQCQSNGYVGASLNSNQLTTAIENITDSAIWMIAGQTGDSANLVFLASRTGWLNAGDVIRPHVDISGVQTSVTYCRFNIVRVG